MDPGGLVVIPRRKSTLNDKSEKADLIVVETDKEVTWNDLPTSDIVVVTQPSIRSRRSRKSSSSSDNETNDASPQIKEAALTFYNDNKSGKAYSKSAVDKERVRIDAANEGRQYRSDVRFASNRNTASTSVPRSSSRSRAVVTTSRDHGVVVIEGNYHHGDNEDDVGRKDESRTSSRSSRGSFKKSNDAVGEGGKNRKGGETKEHPDKVEGGSAIKRELSRKKSQELNSISGSREAIRLFSRTNILPVSPWKMKRQEDGDDAKKPSWKDRVGSSSPETSDSFMNRFGSKISGTTTIAEKEMVASTETPAPTAKSCLASREKARGIRSLSQQRAASKKDVRGISPPSQNIRRRPSLSPVRGNEIKRSVSSQRPSSRGSSHSRSRSPSPSPRRSRRSLSPHSSRESSHSRSRSPSPHHRRRNSPHSYSSSSRSRSPSPRRRRSSHRSYSLYSRSKSPFRSRTPTVPRRRLRRCVSPPGPRYGSRRCVRFHSRSRTPSPRRMREFGGAMRRRSHRVNHSRAILSQSPPRERRPNHQFPMKRQSSVPRGPSFSSRGQSPRPRGGRRQMSAQGNQYQNRCKSGPNCRPQKRIPPRNGRRRRGSSSTPLNRSFSHHERVERRNSDFVPRPRGAPIGSTRRRPALQRSGSFENRRRIMPAAASFAPRSLSPPRMRPQSQQRQNSDGYKRRVSRTHAVESEALVVRNQSPSTVDVSMASPLALVPRVESQSSLHEQDKRRSSASTESTGVWIDCPKQNYDPCDDDLTSSECQGVRGEDSYATYDATKGIPPLGPPSVAHSFATYEVPDGPPNVSDRRVDLPKCTKPYRNDQCSNQTRSKAADLAMLSKFVEDVTAMQSKHTARFAEGRDEASSAQLVEQGIARKASKGSLSSLDKKQRSSFVPGPPPKKSTNSSFAAAPEPPRPTPPPELVRRNTSSVRNFVAKNESNVPVSHQNSPDNDLPFRRQPSPPLPPPRSSDNSPFETHQPVISNPFQDTLQVPTVGNNWRQYLVRGKRNTSISPGRDTSRGRASGSGRSGSRERLNKMFGRAPEKLDDNDRQVNNVVTDMPFRDQFGDYGIYKGQVNEQGRPNGKGTMKYDNGIFYEGMWTDGCQDETAALQYHRVRSGFTSWKGKGKAAVKSGKTLPWNATKIDRHDENDKTNVRGMEWVDLNGDSGRYTGEVNKDQLPHGKGIMKYDFGLIAEGEWVNGVLKENPHDRMVAAASVASGGGALSVISGARSVALSGGMSVGPGMSGGMSVGPMRPPIFVGGGMPQGSVYGGMPQMIQPQQVMPQQMMMNPMMMMMPHQPNNTAQQHTIIAQQNAMMKRMYSSASGSVYGGGSLYGGPIPMAAQMPPSQQQIMPMQQQQPPPITEIKLN